MHRGRIEGAELPCCTCCHLIPVYTGEAGPGQKANKLRLGSDAGKCPKQVVHRYALQ